MSTPEQPRKARHLIDFDAPATPRDAARDAASLTRVQRWVMSVLAVTTVGHLAVGLVVAEGVGGVAKALLSTLGVL